MDVTIPCPCPPKADGTARHESDTVTLRDKLGYRPVKAIYSTVAFARIDDPEMAGGEVLSYLSEGYILHGIESWTLVDEKNKPIEVTRASIRDRILSRSKVAEPIGEAGEGLYGPDVLGPLVERALSSSEPSQTDDSTSPKTDGDSPMEPSSKLPRSPKPSKPSLTSITGTAGIGTITSAPDGVSSSSQSSTTAA